MKALVFSALMMSATFSFANEAQDELMNRAAFDSRLTRAEVMAEFEQARAEGTLVDGPAYSLNTLSESQLTRQQVTNDYIQARADGSLVDTSEGGSMHAPVFAGRRPAENFAGSSWAESE
jgi:hypothetical protein